MSRQTYHHGDLRKAGLAAALEQVAAGGPDSINLRGIARAIGVNHRAVARHFGDKRGLRAALSIDALRDLADAMGATRGDAGRPIREALAASAGAYVRFGVEQPSRYLVVFGPRLNEDGRFPELEDAIEACIGVVRSILTAAVDRGEIGAHDTFVEALKLWSALHGYTHLAALRRWNVRDAKLGAWGEQALEPVIEGLVAALEEKR